MKGKHKVVVQNRSVRFSFELERNINIVRGDSATGKTTLINLIADYQSQGDLSGVQLSCDKECVVMSGLKKTWESFLNGVKDSIVFIDEGEVYPSSKEFASFIKNTDNYYVIVTRNNLFNLPYSVDAIFEIKRSGKYGKLQRTYNSFKRMYGDNIIGDHYLRGCEEVIVEDSKAGFMFYDKVCDDVNVRCISSGGKGNIFQTVVNSKSSALLVIADGAAFGPEMDNVYGISKKRGIDLFLPECFEWLILSSGIIKNEAVARIIEMPCNFIESSVFFSWEIFFTDCLIKFSKGKSYQYNKRELNKYYLSKKSIEKILKNFFIDYR